MLDIRSGWARAAIIALVGWCTLQAFVILVGLDYVAGGGVDVWFATLGVVGLAQLLSLGVLVLSAPFVLTWMYRAMATAHERDRDLTISPAGAVFWFFVPIANLWKPYEAMVQIVEGNAPRTQLRSKERDMILWWWAGWIGRNIVGSVGRFFSTNGYVFATMVAAVIGVGSAVALITIIRGVDKTQTGWVDASIFA